MQMPGNLASHKNLGIAVALNIAEVLCNEELCELIDLNCRLN